MTTRIVLVRHGEARASVEQFVAGPAGCKGLTERGRDQAARLRDRLARSGEIVPDVVLSSTLRRAHETAELVQAAFPAGTPFVAADDYMEQHVGEGDGLTMADFEARYGAIDDTAMDTPMAPGGESPRMFDERVRRVTAGIVDEYPDHTVILFTHGGFVTAATLYLLGAPGAHATGGYWIPPRNTALNVLVSDPRMPGWALERYNDAAHLAD